VALAEANRALREPGQDGILFAIEVQDLNLEGTELVVISGANSALGQIDYDEGISGLVRAFRTAGARYILATTNNVSDQAASEFIERFYRHWLGQAISDPGAALRAAQLEFLAEGDQANRAIWAQFLLVGG
jgi:CHAT domain-containing protein